MTHDITVEGGTSVRLSTAGKYCDRDIVVTSTGWKAKYEQLLRSMIDRKITEIEDAEVTTIGDYAFRKCSKLVTARFPKATSIGVCAFQQTALVNAEMPLLGSISNSAFYGTKVVRLDFWRATSIDVQAFLNAPLVALVLRYPDGVCTLKNISALSGTPIAKGTGYIYVPAALVDSYKAATNWTTYASQLRALEDYTVDGTATGELDPEKIGG